MKTTTAANRGSKNEEQHNHFSLVATRIKAEFIRALAGLDCGMVDLLFWVAYLTWAVCYVK
ncbi:MAG: hypothetical protein Q8Q40_13880 [Methylococcaceae bacterium]|nr:hypothetical protein [Methylococcaceae bacterium]MDP3905046.1 hypothetical protein [Methylococcaceae bacterium]